MPYIFGKYVQSSLKSFWQLRSWSIDKLIMLQDMLSLLQLWFSMNMLLAPFIRGTHLPGNTKMKGGW